MLLSINSIFSIITPPKEIHIEHHQKIENIFVYNAELIACREAPKRHCFRNTELFLKHPCTIEDTPCENTELRCLINFINCIYWKGEMPYNVTMVLIQIRKLVPNKNLFTLLIANIIHQTSGFTKLDSAFYNDKGKYRPRGIIQLQGEENYKLASEPVNIDFVAKPEALATLEPNAVIGSVYVWRKIAAKNGGEKLYFEKSVEMIKVWEAEKDNRNTEEAKKKWNDRRKIYKRICKCFDLKPNFLDDRNNLLFDCFFRYKNKDACEKEVVYENEYFDWCGGDHKICREFKCCKIYK